MSFSSDVRNELARIIPEKECCREAELAALLAVSGDLAADEDGRRVLRVQADNAATARKIITLLKENYHQIQSTVKAVEQRRFKKKRIYEVNVLLDGGDEALNKDLEEILLLLEKEKFTALNRSLLVRTCCKRAYLRGIFLSRGSINRPEGEYHLELVLNDNRLAFAVQKMLDKFELEPGLVERKNHWVVYLKESEKIVDFLRVVEASRALLNFENVRIIKSVRNDVNRQVNCETANLSKTIDASVRQLELIGRLFKEQGLELLPGNLRNLAEMRMVYPDASLKELGVMLDPPLSKSGVAYRMRKLEETIKEILQED
ncbi:MAG: DNA-binding protein WhiA [Syntrophomonas sp.]|uniref:DNA-binding protein WhiA n=1 Tax=Syntrophomonas sp. TaxID=2053627 RepID=UPI0026057DBB|nr:DNA-binding protein WhiA [Syntrophomonas sp.]MDD2510200.1 DNA-binding protein WhiA [Syntrophomonas sp.]MDD3879232.1 DNA-binding protein WhiA [Syntrophomonas sp.]MDD4626480.1 DNA-binding protein WhiA [Syntrophomonas sp.]